MEEWGEGDFDLSTVEVADYAGGDEVTEVLMIRVNQEGEEVLDTDTALGNLMHSNEKTGEGKRGCGSNSNCDCFKENKLLKKAISDLSKRQEMLEEFVQRQFGKEFAKFQGEPESPSPELGAGHISIHQGPKLGLGGNRSNLDLHEKAKEKENYKPSFNSVGPPARKETPAASAQNQQVRQIPSKPVSIGGTGSGHNSAFSGYPFLHLHHPRPTLNPWIISPALTPTPPASPSNEQPISQSQLTSSPSPAQKIPPQQQRQNKPEPKPVPLPQKVSIRLPISPQQQQQQQPAPPQRQQQPILRPPCPRPMMNPRLIRPLMMIPIAPVPGLRQPPPRLRPPLLPRPPPPPPSPLSRKRSLSESDSEREGRKPKRSGTPSSSNFLRICPTCKVTMSRENFTEHVLTSHQGQRMPCPQCSGQFATGKQFRQHLTQTHNVPKEEAFYQAEQAWKVMQRSVAPFINEMVAGARALAFNRKKFGYPSPDLQQPAN